MDREIKTDLAQELNDSTRIDVTNLYGWDVSFAGIHTHQFDGFFVGGYKTVAFTFKELYDQVHSGNVALVGVGNGVHAQLLIEDEQIRDLLLGSKDEPFVLTNANIKKMLSIQSKDKFEKEMNNLITTRGEAREMLYRWDDLGLDNLVAWKGNLLEKHCFELMKAITEFKEIEPEKRKYR